MKRALLALAVVAAGVLFGVVPAGPAQSAPVSLDARGMTTAEACPFASQYVFTATFVFAPDQCWTTPGGTLAMRADGDLTVLDNSWQTICRSGTSGFPGASAVFQNDGNLVIYRNGQPLWQSGTAGNPGATLTFTVNGRLAIRDGAGRKIWDLCTG